MKRGEAEKSLAAGDGVGLQPRDAQLLLPGRIEVRHLRDGRCLAQQADEVVALLLGETRRHSARVVQPIWLSIEDRKASTRSAAARALVRCVSIAVRLAS